jgi:hypothetical protein
MQRHTTHYSPSSVPPVPNRKQRTGTSGAHTLPPSWQPKETTLDRLAGRLGTSPAAIRAQYLRPFAAIATARAFMYGNWDTAFKRAVVDDWAGVRASPV